MAEVARVEEELTAYALERLHAVPGVTVYGPDDPTQRVGVFSFNDARHPVRIVATYLNDYHDIAVRDGCFCAHPYLKVLLGIDAGAERRYLEEMACHDRRNVPGMVRASLGIYSTRDDVNALAAALGELAKNPERYTSRYTQGMDGVFSHAVSEPRPSVAPEPLFSLDAVFG